MAWLTVLRKEFLVRIFQGSSSILEGPWGSYQDPQRFFIGLKLQFLLVSLQILTLILKPGYSRIFKDFDQRSCLPRSLKILEDPSKIFHLTIFQRSFENPWRSLRALISSKVLQGLTGTSPHSAEHSDRMIIETACMQPLKNTFWLMHY